MRRWLLLAGAAVVAVLSLAAGPAEALPVRASAVVCVTGVLLLVTRRSWSGWLWTTAAAGMILASAAATCWVRITGSSVSDVDDRMLLWSLAETSGLVALVVLVVRTAPLPHGVVVGGVGGIVEAAVSLRLSAPWGPPVEGFWFVVWGLAAVGGAALGSYLRALETRRAHSIERAVAAQRLALARDLHDFVGHDLTGIVVQAQSGQVVADRDPAAAVAALCWIEKTGMQALAATDRAVHVLGPQTVADSADVPDIVTLVDRFAAGAPQVNLHLAEVGELPREVGTTAYRVVAEALTNIRRHASAAAAVDVSVDQLGDCLWVTVTNGSGDRPPRLPVRTSGLGLVGLQERVEALGGRFRAEPDPSGGWVVEAEIPVLAP